MFIEYITHRMNGEIEAVRYGGKWIDLFGDENR